MPPNVLVFPFTLQTTVQEFEKQAASLCPNDVFDL